MLFLRHSCFLLIIHFLLTLLNWSTVTSLYTNIREIVAHNGGKTGHQLIKVDTIIVLIYNISNLYFKCPATRLVSRENRESGENPGRYRRCVCIGCLLVDESQSLRNWEGRARIGDSSPVHKSEDLLGEDSACGNGRSVLCCRKSAAAALGCRSFLFWRQKK